MDGDQGIAELKSLDDAITTVEEVLTPKLNAKFNDYCEGMSEEETAQFHIIAGYALCSLCYVYLKSQGIDPSDHPISDELERIKIYVGKVKDLVKRMSAPKLDKEATKRIIENSLAEKAHDENAFKKDTEKKSEKKEEKKEKQTPKTPQSAKKRKAQQSPKSNKKQRK